MAQLPPVDKKKILFFYENAGDGTDAVALAIRELSSGLAAAGLEPETALPLAKRRNSASAGVKLFFQVVYLLRAARVLFRFSRSERVVVTLDVPTGLRSLVNAASSLRILKIIHISWVMDLYRFLEKDAPEIGLVPRLQKALDQAGLANSSHTVVLGQCMRTVLKGFGGVEPVVIPIWQDPEKFPNVADPELSELRKKLSLEGKFVVLYSGSARDLHPLDGLVEAAKLLEGVKNIAFLIIGRGSEIDRVRRRANDLSLKNVRILDFRPANEVHLFAAVADLHVVSLSEEATGTCVPSKAYSAMASERPLLYLGSEASQVALDVLESGSGVVSSPRDADAIADLVRELAANPLAAKEMGANGRAYFLKNRALQSGVDSWHDLIRSL